MQGVWLRATVHAFVASVQHAWRLLLCCHHTPALSALAKSQLLLPHPSACTLRYHQELLDSQQLRAAAAEAAALRSGLEETSAASAGLATACEELRRALDSSTAGLAAAKERVRRLEAAEGLTQALAAVVSTRSIIKSLRLGALTVIAVSYV